MISWLHETKNIKMKTSTVLKQGNDKVKEKWSDLERLAALQREISKSSALFHTPHAVDIMRLK